MMLLRYLPRFRKAYRALRVLEAREGWSREDVEAHQLARLNAVWAHAAVHVPHYRALSRRLDLPPRFHSLDEFKSLVPVLPKAAVRDRPRDFLSEAAAPGRWRRTSGSTGAPTNVYWADAAHRETLQAKYRFQAAWGLDVFDRAVFFWGLGDGLLPGWAGRVARTRQSVEDWLRNRVRLSAYRLGPDDLRRALDRIAALRPAWLYAFSAAAYLLAREARASGFSCDSLRLAVLTSEPAYPRIVAAVERGLGVPAAIEYGSMECGFLAGSAPDRTLRVREDLVLMETPPRGDGGHEVLVTVLNNPSFPLLRYAIGDVVDRPLEVSDRGFAQLLGAVTGRDADFLRTRSGRLLHSMQVESLFEFDAAVRRYQARQHADGDLTVQLERAAGREPDAERLRLQLRELLEGFPVEVLVVDALAPSASGKHRWLVSDCAGHPRPPVLPPLNRTPLPEGANA